ncbi:hypothetical protein Tco_0567110 [Tanacetum coccineum]
MPLRWRFLILYQAYANLYATTGRKAHLLEDKKIPSVWVFDEVILEALGGNTCDLDSIWEETGQDYNFTRSGFKNACIVPGDGVANPATPSENLRSDGVRSYCDGVELHRLKETLEVSREARRQDFGDAVVTQFPYTLRF